MRVGNNPNKIVDQKEPDYNHQVIIPVYIPNEEGYFKDAIKVLKLCLESLNKTVHSKTYITVVNNGSYKAVENYLDKLFLEKKINELIHTDNIGKVNAVLKGLTGNNIELVTISDADVLFLANWQLETMKVFNHFSKAGVVGLTPQFKMFEANCSNMIFENILNKNFKFISVINKKALIYFYDSIGWDRNYNKDYLNLGLGLIKEKFHCFVGAGHYVATYKKDIFEEIQTYIGGKKVSGIGETYLDEKALEKGYWRLTTHDNFAFHMGNVHEHWMQEELEKLNDDENEVIELNFKRFNPKISKLHFFIKNKLFAKLFSNRAFRKLFYKYKKLPKKMIANY